MRRQNIMAGFCLGLFLLLCAPAAWTQEVYCRYQIPTGIFYGQVEGETILELDAAPWKNGQPTGQEVPVEKVRLLHPSEPVKIIGLSGSYQEAWPDSEPYNTVRWFLKPPTSAASPYEPVLLPDALDEVLVETELTIIIGKRVKNANLAQAEEAIFGYTVANDIVGSVTSYHENAGEPADQPEPILPLGLKQGDGFAPYGPYIYRGVDWNNRQRTLRIIRPSGEEATYEHNTANLVYPPAKMVRDLSRVFVLEPGDVIMTGTTAALPARSGDRVIVGVEGLGTLENLIGLPSQQ